MQKPNEVAHSLVLYVTPLRKAQNTLLRQEMGTTCINHFENQKMVAVMRLKKMYSK